MHFPWRGSYLEKSRAIDLSDHVLEDVKFWLKVRRESRLVSIRCLEDAAKQLIVIASMLQGIYFAVISLSDIKKIATLNDPWFIVFVILSIFVLVLWMMSLYFATLVFIPEKYKRTESQERTESHEQNTQKWLKAQAKEIFDSHGVILEYKNKNLKLSLWFLWISFPILAINILIYLVCIPAAAAK
jgi:hypothetical protein